MTYKTITKQVPSNVCICDLCEKPIIVTGWVLGRDPRKTKTHYHIDCLIKLADEHVKRQKVGA